MGTTTVREATAKPGDVIEGRYRIIKTIGEGGMGTVYLAEHTLIKRRVAVKLLHPEFANDASVIERFMNEARAAGTLGHPNIVESTDMGFSEARVPYIVFEYLEGSLLTDEIYRLGGLPVRRAVYIAQQMASALHAAHAAGIVHRDLKSDNIFLTDKDDALDHVKVLDFGISRFLEVDDEQTRRGMIMGTPEFMAPEQITAPDTVDARADIYALGVILYEMLSAKRPFTNDDPRTLLHRIVHNDPPMLERADAPRGLIDLVMKLLQKEPSKRLASMLDVDAALQSFSTLSEARPRRRTGIVGVPESADTQIDLARVSRASLHRAGAITPSWSNGSLDATAGLGLELVGLPNVGHPAHTKNHKMWGMVAAGLALGVGGMVFGLTRHSNAPAQPSAPLASPVAVVAAATPSVLPAAAVPQNRKVPMRIGADVADARVTFRRRVAVAPSKMEITTTDIIEMVEVSAPGHKTVRFWLTIDRPTNLTAKLPVGVGLVEATDEQTLIALGELADTSTMPATLVTAVPPPAAVESGTVVGVARPAVTVPLAALVTANIAPVPSTTPIIAAKTANTVVAVGLPPARKIGRGSLSDAGEIVVDGDGATPEPNAPSIPPTAVIEWPSDATSNDGAVAPTVAVELPAAEPPTAELPAVAVPPAVAEPAVDASLPKPEPIAVVVPTPVAKPSIERHVVNAVVAAHHGEILKCFADGKKIKQDLKGQITVVLNVNAAGVVTRPQVQSGLGAPMVAACVAKAVSRWTFPARPGGAVAQVAYPFTLN